MLCKTVYWRKTAGLGMSKSAVNAKWVQRVGKKGRCRGRGVVDLSLRELADDHCASQPAFVTHDLPSSPASLSMQFTHWKPSSHSPHSSYGLEMERTCLSGGADAPPDAGISHG